MRDRFMPFAHSSAHCSRRTSAAFAVLIASLLLSCTSPDSKPAGPTDACEKHCTCVGLVCSGVEVEGANYDTCIERCGSWTTEEQTCAFEWCEPVMWGLPGSFKLHACDHAVLASGLEVCLGQDHQDVSGDVSPIDDAGSQDVTDGGADVDPPMDATSTDTSAAQDVTSGDDGQGQQDAETDLDATADGDASDAGASDAGTVDAGAVDAGALDGGTTDVGAKDTGALDSSPADTSTADTGPADTGPADTGFTDTGPADTGTADTNNKDAGTSDAGGVPIKDCKEYCTCLLNSCGGYTGYPFANETECVNTCGKFTIAQWGCYPKWCSAVSLLSSDFTKQHTCQHAWGELGLLECDIQGWKSGPFEECLFSKCYGVASGCAKTEGCGTVGVCMSGCDWKTSCIEKTCKPKYTQEAWKAFEPVLACAKQKGCVP